MPAEYPETILLFHLLDEAAPYKILDGPGHDPVARHSDGYTELARSLTDAAADVRVALAHLHGAQRGVAADASHRHLERLALVGEAGAAQAEIAQAGVQLQADHVAAARRAVEASPVPGEAPFWEGLDGSPSGRALAASYHAQRAAAAADLYQTNANHTYTAGFSTFDTPAAGAPNTAAAAGIGGVGPAGIGAAGGGSPGLGGGIGAGGGSGGADGIGTAGGRGVADAPAAGQPGRGAGDGVTPGGVPGAGVPGGSRGGTAPSHRPGTGPAPIPARPTPPGPWPSPRTPDPTHPRRDTTGMLRRPWPNPDGGVREASPGGSRPGTWTPGGPYGHPHPGPPSRPQPSSPPPAAPGPRASAGHVLPPMVPGSSSGRDGDTEHRRPPWLLQDDPEAIWFAGLPAYTDPVIGGELNP